MGQKSPRPWGTVHWPVFSETFRLWGSHRPLNPNGKFSMVIQFGSHINWTMITVGPNRALSISQFSTISEPSNAMGHGQNHPISTLLFIYTLDSPFLCSPLSKYPPTQVSLTSIKNVLLLLWDPVLCHPFLLPHLTRYQKSLTWNS
jgi:hypothetical protein